MSGTPNSFDIRGASLGPLATNAYAFHAPGGWVAVDAPEGAAAWLEGQGIRPDLLLLTHQHFDHVLGAGEIVDRFNPAIWAFAEPDPDLTLERFFRGFEGTGFEIAAYSVARRLDALAGGEGIDVLGAEVDLLHVPGHSPDSLCFVLPAAGVVFGGDVLFNGGIGRTDFPGGDGELLVRGIRDKLLPLSDRWIVFPGHGPQTTIGVERANNPFL